MTDKTQSEDNKSACPPNSRHSSGDRFGPLMEWSGRAPAPPASEAGEGRPDKEHAMSQKLNSAVAVIGIDIGKNSFHIVGHDQRGAIVLREKWSRSQVETRLANLPPA